MNSRVKIARDQALADAIRGMSLDEAIEVYREMYPASSYEMAKFYVKPELSSSRDIVEGETSAIHDFIAKHDPTGALGIETDLEALTGFGGIGEQTIFEEPWLSPEEAHPWHAYLPSDYEKKLDKREDLPPGAVRVIGPDDPAFEGDVTIPPQAQGDSGLEHLPENIGTGDEFADYAFSKFPNDPGLAEELIRALQAHRDYRQFLPGPFPEAEISTSTFNNLLKQLEQRLNVPAGSLDSTDIQPALDMRPELLTYLGSILKEKFAKNPDIIPDDNTLILELEAAADRKREMTEGRGQGAIRREKVYDRIPGSRELGVGRELQEESETLPASPEQVGRPDWVYERTPAELDQEGATVKEETWSPVLVPYVDVMGTGPKRVYRFHTPAFVDDWIKKNTGSPTTGHLIGIPPKEFIDKIVKNMPAFKGNLDQNNVYHIPGAEKMNEFLKGLQNVPQMNIKLQEVGEPRKASMLRDAAYFGLFQEFDLAGEQTWILNEEAGQIMRNIDTEKAVREGGLWDFEVGDQVLIDDEISPVEGTITARLSGRKYTIKTSAGVEREIPERQVFTLKNIL